MLTLSADKSFIRRSPWLTIAENAMAQMLRFATEFGATPASRSGVSAHPQQQRADVWSQLDDGA